MKGVTQIAQEGAIQIFQDYNLEMSEIIVGVVGTLQFDVLKYRMENEYSCEVKLEPLPYGYIRWIKDTTTDLSTIKVPSDAKQCKRHERKSFSNIYKSVVFKTSYGKK